MSHRRVWARTGLVLVVVVLVVAVLGGLGGGRAGGGRSNPRSGSGSHGRSPGARPASAGTTAAAPSANHGLWRVAWGSAMAWAQPGVIADHATVRQLARVALGGRAVRIRISNRFGSAPLIVGAATVARSAGGAALVPGTVHRLTFHGRPGVTIPVGATALSDPARLAVAGGQTVAASVYVTAPDLVTVHPYGNLGMVSFATGNGGGDQTADAGGGGAFGYASAWPRLVDAVDVRERRGRGSVVVMGDSITDGFNATLRWTDLLQRRIDQLPVADRRAVINEGITANALEPIPGDDSRTGGGIAGVRRLKDDVLAQPGVSYLVLFLGTNDLFFGDTASQVIAGMRAVIRRAHHAGISVLGVTLLPRAGSERWDPAQFPDHEPFLEQIDRWIRTAHAFDGVIDMAHAVADVYDGQCQPTAMFAPYDSGDHLHPDAAGQTAMANAVNTARLGMPPAPRLAPLVTATPTSGCAGR
jgi:lysophospholipase L1-like esterase